MLTIASLPASDSRDDVLVARLADLVNEVYETAEQGLWIPGTTRTTVDEIAELIRAGELWVARLDDEVVGCVRIRQLDERTAEFGMLVAAPKYRGIGIGRELVRFAEKAGRSAGAAVMQLEVLVPQDWAHPSKEFLRDWYGRIGYRVVRTGDFQVAEPRLAPLLATPCDYVVFHKPLTGGKASAG
ncbi:Acetyltransferase (GNAT) family protein [Cryptosporangium aurantiacum]|uniref:Acetyltransferase (GNAT) family protein n=1 Tax=Cryptosporangium aurantiacum TaxID=134849 RepID=A0A1M7TY10_9ACTN|nr:Acetyltransferase (GNAT) family protein [Cryptosporangium aurantiacum]